MTSGGKRWPAYGDRAAGVIPARWPAPPPARNPSSANLTVPLSVWLLRRQLPPRLRLGGSRLRQGPRPRLPARPRRPRPRPRLDTCPLARLAEPELLRSSAARRRYENRHLTTPGWTQGVSRDPPGEKSRGLPEDLDLLLEPLHLAPQPLGLGLLGLAGGQRLRRAGRQVLVAPSAQLPGAPAELGRDLAQPLAAVQQTPDRLRLELGGEPPPLLPLRHPTLLRCSGSLANPPLRRGRSKPAFGPPDGAHPRA